MQFPTEKCSCWARRNLLPSARSSVLFILLPASITPVIRSSVIPSVTGTFISPTETRPPVTGLLLPVFWLPFVVLALFQVFKLILEVHDTVRIFRKLETFDWWITDIVPVHFEFISVFCCNSLRGFLNLSVFCNNPSIRKCVRHCKILLWFTILAIFVLQFPFPPLDCLVQKSTLGRRTGWLFTREE